MVSLLCELQFWTMKDDVDVKDSDLGCFKLYDKGDVDPEEPYLEAKEAYAKGRRLERRLTVNSLKDWVLNWWSVGDGEVWPWMPSTSNRERSNMVVYALNGPNVELLTYGRVDKIPVLVSFSQYQSNKLLIVEEDASRGGSVAVDVCIYELGRGKFERVSMISISLQGRVVTSQWNNAEDKLVLLCDDTSLVLYDAVRQTTHFTTTSFVGTKVTWHPGGSVVFFASEDGQLQCFDTALSTIQLRLNDELASPAPTLNVGSYLRGPLAIFKLTLGLLTRGQLGPLELVCQYLKHSQADEAICLLLSLDWGRVAEQAFHCLSKIINFLLRKSLDAKLEAQLETALGSFYGPAQPIPEPVVAEYGVRVRQAGQGLSAGCRLGILRPLHGSAPHCKEERGEWSYGCRLASSQRSEAQSRPVRLRYVW
ncbi:hypothetical protein HPB48_024778 [Haemaphysalis longicornis]|uniref:Uncharacterized protein n=1 Tax=Haemaphysalis longicornis TaxID=44386 RepID=A0A9J6H701_HAELO|nr:hypothetical protein HPB48_024778 [Haemaphysalis longicornis]